MQIQEYPKTGDIVCTRSDKFLGKSIRWFQEKQKEGESKVNHIAWSLNNKGVIIEALNKVEINNVKDYLETNQDVYVVRIRSTFLKKQKLYKALDYGINKYKGKFYAYGKIGLQMLDTLFRTNKFTGSSFSNFPYCSELVAKCLMRKCGFLFYNKKKRSFIDPKSVTPANILSDGLNRKNVFRVFKYVRSPKSLDFQYTMTWKLEEIN
jgi:hypothetical protein